MRCLAQGYLTGALKGSWHSEIHLLNMKKIDFHFHFYSASLKFQTALFGERHRYWRFEDGHDFCITIPTFASSHQNPFNEQLRRRETSRFKLP